MIYILDGNNIIGRARKTEDACIKLILMIKHAKKLLKHKVIIFFDGNNLLDDRISLPKNMIIYYSGERTADEAIIDYVRKIKKRDEIIVVTEDRDLQRAAKYYGGNIIESNQFLMFISKEKGTMSKESISKKLPTDAHKITEELRKIWLKDE